MGDEVWDRTRPFRGSAARRAGRVTAAQLAGPGFRRLLPDTYVDSTVTVDLALRVRAVGVWQPRGVVAGAAAAVWWGAAEVPAGSVEVVLGRSGGRAPDRVRVRQDQLRSDEVTESDGIRLTTALRTAFDLGRRMPLVGAVAAVDALARLHGFDADDVERLAGAHRHEAGLRALREVLDLVDPRSRSAAASRVRLELRGRRGIPEPVVAPSLADHGRLLGVPDLAWPEHGVTLFAGDGGGRDTWWDAARLLGAGWTVLRLTEHQIEGGPDGWAPEVARSLGQASRARRVSRVSASAGVLSSR